MRIVLGVTGGIAAYKACSLLRLLREAGHQVKVVPTESALNFVGAPTWEALSGEPVSTSVWDNVDEVAHVRIGQTADLVVVAPATADLLGRATHGIANDLLTNVLLSTTAPVVMAPAMHTEMWLNAATVHNVSVLRRRGVHIMEPDSGRLTGTDSGPGRLPEPEAIAEFALAQVHDEGASLAGLRVAITTGGTREALDPVRYLGNRSSGKQGMALAEAARARGAKVELIMAATDVPAPTGVKVIKVESARDMQNAVANAYDGNDVIVMAAAVADFRSASYAETKIKKSHAAGEEESAPVIELVRNPDILAGLVKRRGSRTTPVLVGFAAETGDENGTILDYALAKLERKGCDVIVANEVGEGTTFGQDSSTVHILVAGSDQPQRYGPAPKRESASAIWDVVEQLIPSKDAVESN